MKTIDNEQVFYTGIVQALRDHPQWMGSAVAAIVAGSNAALQDEQRRTNAKDVALRTALTLVNANRITPELRKMLCDTVIAGLAPEGNRCQAETDFAESYGAV
jgi:hypothetical protein